MLKPKPFKAKPYLVNLVELFLNSPTDSDQYKTAVDTVQHRLACGAVEIKDILDASRASATASVLPFGILAGLLSKLSATVVTAEMIAMNCVE